MTDRRHSLVSLTPFELATGWVTGRVTPPSPDPKLRGRSPREVLEALLLPALASRRCVVGFSGGRDSAAVLAVATRLARQHDLPDPVPVTRRYLGDRDAEESAWQELVVRHLGLSEWQILEVQGELELVGELSLAVRRRYGPLWPPMSYVQVFMLDRIPGSVFVTGQGGDEILGAHRLAPVRHAIRQGRHVRRRELRRALGALAPNPLRAAWARRRSPRDGTPPWLRPEAARRYDELVLADHAREPLRADRAIAWVLGFRAVQAAFANLDVLAAERDVRCVHPFLDPSFVAAMGDQWGWRGPADRTQALRHLVGDLLPDEVCARESKATFNTALLGPRSRDFAEGWDGSGVDPRLVDPDRLRETWLSDFPHGGSFALLLDAAVCTQQP